MSDPMQTAINELAAMLDTVTQQVQRSKREVGEFLSHVHKIEQAIDHLRAKLADQTR